MKVIYSSHEPFDGLIVGDEYEVAAVAKVKGRLIGYYLIDDFGFLTLVSPYQVSLLDDEE